MGFYASKRALLTIRVKMIDTSLQKERLLQLTTDTYQDIGGHIDHDNCLHTRDGQVALKPILSTFNNILSSKEYTLLSPLFDSKENFPIADMYVELAVSQSSSQTNPSLLSGGTALSKEIEDKHQRQRAKRIDIEEAMHNEQHQNIVILGDPGSGKTSLLKYLTLLIAKGKSSRWLVPIHISLRQYWQEKQTYRSNGKELTLTQYGASRLVNEQHGSSSSKYSLIVPHLWDKKFAHVTEFMEHSARIENILAIISGSKKEHVLFLLDGFDELASQKDAIDALTIEISQLSHGFSWVLTSRHTGFYGDLNEDIRYEMISLHDQGIIDLVSNWFGYMKDPESHNNRKDILAQIQKNPRLLNMARNPFLLTLLCNIRHFSNSSLPVQRSAIYDQIIKLVRAQLRFRSKNSELFGKSEYDYLTRFCYYLYTDVSNAPLQLFDHDHWQACALPDKPPSLKDHFLASRLISSWRENSDYHFSHLTFQEYLIALHLSSLPFEKVRQHLYTSYWKVALRFLSGIYWNNSHKDRFVQLLRAMIAPVDIAGLLYIEAAWYCVEAGIEDTTAILGEDLRETLWTIWQDDKIHSYTSSQHYREIIAEALTTLDQDFVYYKVNEETIDKNISTRMVFLLGYMTSKESDEKLIELFYEPKMKQSHVNAIVSAIASKATPEIRECILKRITYPQATWIDERLTDLARQSQHSDFIPHLISQLNLVSDDNIGVHTKLFKAIEEMNNIQFFEPLTTLINGFTDLEKIPKALLRAYANLKTSTVRSWFIENSKQSTNIFLLASEQNWLDTSDVIGKLSTFSTGGIRQYFDAVSVFISSGGKLDFEIEQSIADIAFSDNKTSVAALRVLAKISSSRPNESLYKNTYIKNYRELLRSRDSTKAAIAVDVLTDLSDYHSYNVILNLIKDENIGFDQELELSILYALANLSTPKTKNSTVSVLKNIITEALLGFNKGNKQMQAYYEQVLKSGIESLLKVDINYAFDYFESEFPQNILMDVLCYISIEQGYLFFKSNYVTPQGDLIEWHAVSAPMPQLDIAKSGNEQQGTLRELCQYLIATKKASLAGQYIKGQSAKIPLFKGEGISSDVSAIKSISRSAGNKFLRGSDIAPNSANLLMAWIVKNFI